MDEFSRKYPTSYLLFGYSCFHRKSLLAHALIIRHVSDGGVGPLSTIFRYFFPPFLQALLNFRAKIEQRTKFWISRINSFWHSPTNGLPIDNFQFLVSERCVSCVSHCVIRFFDFMHSVPLLVAAYVHMHMQMHVTVSLNSTEIGLSSLIRLKSIRLQPIHSHSFLDDILLFVICLGCKTFKLYQILWHRRMHPFIPFICHLVFFLTISGLLFCSA